MNPANNVIDNDESWLPLSPFFQFSIDNDADEQQQQHMCRANILNSLHNQDRVLKSFYCKMDARRCRLLFMDGQVVTEKHDADTGYIKWQKFCHDRTRLNGGDASDDDAKNRNKDYCVWVDRPEEAQDYQDFVDIEPGQECGASFQGDECHACHKTTCEYHDQVQIPGFAAECQRKGQQANVQVCFPSKTDIPLWTVHVEGSERSSSSSLLGGIVVLLEVACVAAVLGFLALWMYKKRNELVVPNPLHWLRRHSLVPGDDPTWTSREFQMSDSSSSSGSFSPPPMSQSNYL